MRRIVVFCIVATVLAAVTSCGTAKRIEQQPTAEEERTQLWAGKEYSDIVQSYGDPDRIAPDGNDGCILIYETVSTVMETDSDDAPTTVQEERDYTHFYLDQEGFCYPLERKQSWPLQSQSSYTYSTTCPTTGKCKQATCKTMPAARHGICGRSPQQII